MLFGSKYVYKYAHSESESVSDDDDVIGNDNDPLFIPQITGRSNADGKTPQSKAASASGGSALASHKRKRLRKPDTNVISVKFDRLLQPGEMHAGDPVPCTQCNAIASHLSKIQAERNESNDTESKWHCEFCRNNNSVDIEQTDLPKHEDATYLLSPAPAVYGSDITGIDDSMVFFLIDVSGSMSSTTLVHGAINLPNALQQQERAAEAFGGAPMIRQHHQTYVSRLQGVQMAVAANLDKIVKDTPTKRAAVLTFNHELTYYGDGTRDEPLVIRGDKLNNAADLLNEAEREAHNELKPVAQTKAKLIERVYDLEEGGQTALGPAVVFALNIASKRQGSKIVICTDGLANRGLGSLELAQDEKAEEAVKMHALEEGNQFYADLTQHARDKGVSISVITIKGTACLLPVIGQMADGTGSNVTIVDLLNMRDEFASILEQQVIATNAEATLVLHRGLYIRDPDNPDEKLEGIKRVIGNVTKQTEVTFEYGVRNKDELKEKYHIDLDKLQQLPFQIQVKYTAADGSKALRVLTQLRETTDDREVAEINAVRSVIAENHIRSTANDMMAAMSDEEEDGAVHTRSKWSTPVVQKQRLAYMDNLNTKAHSSGTYERDQFNERRWNKASNELQSHVITSRSRKADALRHTAVTARRPPSPPSSSSGSSLFGSIGNKVSSFFSGTAKEETYERSAIVPSTASRSSVRRGYGFATSNLNNFSDQHSEDLYRYKNISSDYMRETSPTRDDDSSDTNRLRITSGIRRPAARRSDDDDDQPVRTSNTGRFVTGRFDNDDRSARASDTDRSAHRRTYDEEQPTPVANTRRFATRRNDDDDQPSSPSGTDRSAYRWNDNSDQPAGVSNTDRFATKRNDNDDGSARVSDTDRFARRRNYDEEQPAPVANTRRFATRRNDDDDQPSSPSGTDRSGNRWNVNSDQPPGVSNTDRFATKRNDNDDGSARVSDTDRFARRRNDDPDQSARVSNTGRFGNERKNTGDDDDDVVSEERQ